MWERLDEFAAPEVTPGFDARLYARIAAEEAQTVLVAALAVASCSSIGCGRCAWWPWRCIVHPPRTPDAAKQASKAEIEQVAQAVDDLDLLTPIDR